MGSTLLERAEERMLRALLASLLFLATPQVVAGQSPSRSDSSKYAAAISQSRAFIQDELRLLGAPGAAVCVGKDDGIIWSEGFGMADLEGQAATTRQTRFRIGSVSKPHIRRRWAALSRRTA